jgi:DNA-directed RNA polymerase subunit omega
MARVTTEDCVEKLPNRFELIMMASQRARRIGSGAPITLPRDNDKNTVVSLREIAEGTVDTDELKEDLIQSYQRVHEADEDDMDLAELISNEAAASEEEELMKAAGVYDQVSDDDMAPTDDDILESLSGAVDED